MLSRMGGRLINFYADDLVELFLNDFLVETALELQHLEKNQLKDYSQEEAKVLAQGLLKNISEYENEEEYIKMKWNTNTSKVPKAIGLDQLTQQP